MHFSRVCCLAIAIFASELVQARHIPYVLRRETPGSLQPANIQRDLGPQLSNGSSIFFPNASEFENATSRWNAYGAPTISVVVEPMTADDISKTIQYANAHNVSFLANNRGHGSSDTLARMHNGIEIYLNNFATVTVRPDGQSALVGGGMYGDLLADVLQQYNKTSATGVCGCVGTLGGSLGGGHGRMQGFYGLNADNMLSANLILANGTQTNVSSTSHPDLWWALRGAGQNYGIVTELEYRIHDQPSPGWYWSIWHFTQDKLEGVFGVLQGMSDEGIPPEMGMAQTDFLWNTNVSTTEPVIYVLFTYAGSQADAAYFADRFRALEPAMTQEGNSTYGSLNRDTGTSSDDPLCVHGLANLQFAAGLLRYNVTANRAIYETFRATTIAHPEYRGSFVVFETYAQGAFKAVPPNSTAYPHREDNFICTTIIQYQPTTNTTTNDFAMAFGEEIRQMAYQGTDPAHTGKRLTTYMQYAVGSERLEQLYGWEPWRLEKLGRLKREWDPEGKFSFYNGIPAV